MRTIPESERASVPRSEWKRTKFYTSFAIGLAGVSVVLRGALEYLGILVWKGMNFAYSDINKHLSLFHINRSVVFRDCDYRAVLSVDVISRYPVGPS